MLAAARWSKLKLSPGWNDAQILAAFGFTHATAADSEQGVDGTQATYHVGKTRITIVRSASTGLVIRINRGRYAGYWLVEPLLLRSKLAHIGKVRNGSIVLKNSTPVPGGNRGSVTRLLRTAAMTRT
jgi:hypothetical protein